jgi:peptidoglycan/LPS O-acetylase OafA/YrhL
MAAGIGIVSILGVTRWQSVMNGYSLIAAFFALSIWIAVVHAPPPCRLLHWKPLRSFGGISYGLYLYHIAILEICKFSIHSEVLSRLVALGLSVLIARASWRLLERPLLDWQRRNALPPAGTDTARVVPVQA